jgi:hypothetical protein
MKPKGSHFESRIPFGFIYYQAEDSNRMVMEKAIAYLLPFMEEERIRI